MEPNENGSSGKHTFLSYALWLLIIGFLAAYLVGIFGGLQPSETMPISYSKFKEDVSEGKISEVTVDDKKITGVFKYPVMVNTRSSTVSYKNFETAMPSFGDPELLNLLEENDVVINARVSTGPWYSILFMSYLPWIFLLLFFVYLSRRLRDRMGGGMGGGAFSFGKSKAKLYDKSLSNVTFKDVAGLANPKKELSEVVEFLKAPSKFRALGAKLPKGILLVGPPGTGKTLMARATAGEADVPFYSISASEFVEMFVGVGASRVRDLFTNAKKSAPAIIFIDELDAIGRARGIGLGGGHEEREQTLNQILSEMDGFSPNESLVVMAATNRPDVLDAALVRPGRFDRQVIMDLPQRNARREILVLHSRTVPLSDDVDLDAVARRTVGFSGADLKNLVNEAALLAARKGKKKVEAEDFDLGMDKIILGLEREEIISEEERKVIAYHEAGHTLVARLLPGADPLKKVTIIPRGRSLGLTEQLPEQDRYNFNRQYLLNRIAIMLGGRVAEKLVFSDVSSGAGDDLKKATQLATRMVCQWGMSERIGPVSFPRGEQHEYLRTETGESRDFSEATARLIDEEVRSMLQEMERKSEELLTTNRESLDTLAIALLEHETLSKEEIDYILEGRIPPKKQLEKKPGERQAEEQSRQRQPEAQPA